MSEYEFSQPENRVVRSLATVSRIAGWLDLLLAVAIVIVGGKIFSDDPHSLYVVLDVIVVAFSSVFLALFGVWLIRGASHLSRIVTTQGNDVSHLMDAFRELAKIYRTQFWLWMVAIAFVAVSIILRLGIHIARH